MYVYFLKKVDSTRSLRKNVKTNLSTYPSMIKHICNSPFVSSVMHPRSSLFWLHPRRLGFPSFCLRPEEFPLCRRQQDIVEYLEGSCRPAVDAFRPVSWIFHGQGNEGLAIAFSRLLRVEESRGSSRASHAFVTIFRPPFLRSFPVPLFLSWSVVIGACVIDRFLIKLARF